MSEQHLTPEVISDNSGEDKQAPGSPLSLNKTILGIGVFVLLTGSILTVTSQFKPASSMVGMEGHDHGNMSHDDMMQVDGSFNPTPVTVMSVKPSLLTSSVKYTGSIHPYQEITVYPRIAGQLTNYSVYPGDRIRTGEILAELDAGERLTEVAEAVAKIDLMSTNLAASKIELNEQNQEIDRLATELSYRQKKRDRFALLVKEGAISQDQYDIEDTNAQTAQAALKAAQVKLRRLEAKILSARSNLKQAKAQKNTASIMKGYTKIRSPITGIVQERMVDPGVVVQPGMGILKIGDYHKIRLRANVAQQDAVNIKVGTPIVAKIPGTNVNKITGKITSIFPQTNSNTRTVTVEAIVNNPKTQLLSGQFLEMQIITARQSNVLSIPSSALTQFKDKKAVWLVNGEVAQRKTVTTGLISGKKIEITNGLKPGDIVITSGHSKLMENSRVAVVDASGKSVSLVSKTPQSEANTRVVLISPSSPDSIKKGGAQLILEVQNPKTNKPIAVKNLDVKVTMPMKNMPPMISMVEIKPDSQPGRFQIDTHFGMKGKWEVKIKIQDPKYQGKTDLNLTVK